VGCCAGVNEVTGSEKARLERHAARGEDNAFLVLSLYNQRTKRTLTGSISASEKSCVRFEDSEEGDWLRWGALSCLVIGGEQQKRENGKGEEQETRVSSNLFNLPSSATDRDV